MKRNIRNILHPERDEEKYHWQFFLQLVGRPSDDRDLA